MSASRESMSEENTEQSPVKKKIKRKNRSSANKSNKKQKIKNRITELEVVDTFLALAVLCEVSSKPQSLIEVLKSKLLNKEQKKNTIKKYNEYFDDSKFNLQILRSINDFDRKPHALIDTTDNVSIVIIDELVTDGSNKVNYKLRLCKRYFELKGDERAETMDLGDTVDYKNYLKENGIGLDKRNKKDLKSELDFYCRLANRCNEDFTFNRVLRIKNTNDRYQTAKTVKDYNKKYLNPRQLNISSAATTVLYDTQSNQHIAIARLLPPKRKLQLSRRYFELQEQRFPANLATDGWIDYRDIIDMSRTPDKIQMVREEIREFKKFIIECRKHFLEQLKTMGHIDSSLFVSKINSQYKSIHDYKNSMEGEEKAHLQLLLLIKNTASSEDFHFLLFDDLTNKELIGLTGEPFKIQEFEENYPKLKEEIIDSDDRDNVNVNLFELYLDQMSDTNHVVDPQNSYFLNDRFSLFHSEKMSELIPVKIESDNNNNQLDVDNSTNDEWVQKISPIDLFPKTHNWFWNEEAARDNRTKNSKIDPLLEEKRCEKNKCEP